MNWYLPSYRFVFPEELENFEVDSSKIDPEYRKTFFDELQKKWSEVTQDHDGIDEHSWLSEEIGLPDVFKVSTKVPTKYQRK